MAGKIRTGRQMRLMNPKVRGHVPPRVMEPPLYFNTQTLSRFLRISYGANADKEAKRHIAAYTRRGRAEIAEIWKRVLAHLCGIEIKEDCRRIIRAARTLKVRN